MRDAFLSTRPYRPSIEILGMFIIDINICMYVRIYKLLSITCHGKEQGRKGLGKEVQPDVRKVAQPKRVRLGHFVFGK